MNNSQREFIDQASAEAAKVNHPFPQMVACEAALESGHPDPATHVMIYGGSQLAREDNNLFGMKQHCHPVYGTVALPTREFLKGEWTPVTANFVKYPDWASCFADRLATLQRLSNVLPHYAAALQAPDPETYIAEVSKTWSTDPNRGAKVLAIYQEYTAGEPTP